MSTTKRFLVPMLWLLLSASLAFAGPKEAVSRAIGGRTMAGYKAPSGRLRLRVPKVKKDSHAPGDNASLTVGSVNYLDGKHYRDVRNTALKLLRTYHPDKHYFIALGRSPGALAAFLTELNPNMVMTFPASDLRLGVQAEWKNDFFTHFAELIPEDVLEGGRTIVLFDRSHNQSGTSLRAVKVYLEEYLAAKHGKPVTVKAAGLAAQGPLVEGVDHVSIAEHPSTFQYFSGTDHDEVFAPFKDKHRIGTQPMENITENPNHWTFREALRDRMAHDAELKQALKNDFSLDE